jgi:uncharacterized protein (TIGR03435 family)
MVHGETKVLPVYELTVAKNGPKLKESVITPRRMTSFRRSPRVSTQ